MSNESEIMVRNPVQNDENVVHPHPKVKMLVEWIEGKDDPLNWKTIEILRRKWGTERLSVHSVVYNPCILVSLERDGKPLKHIGSKEPAYFNWRYLRPIVDAEEKKPAMEPPPWHPKDK